MAIRERLHRRRFLLPNLVTLSNMFCGFLACTYAANGDFGKATLAIFVAIILDGLDGRVARRFNATSKFGTEFDSFSDLVSFGVAPATLVYHWAFKPLALDFGVLICFLFVLCSACRLARFNLDHENSKSFMGLPTPGAAAFVTSLVHISPFLPPSTLGVVLATLVCVTISYLMVCSTPFLSIKTVRFEHFSLRYRILCGLLIALLWYDSKVGIFTVSFLYAASGPVMAIFGIKPNAPKKAEIEAAPSRIDAA